MPLQRFPRDYWTNLGSSASDTKILGDIHHALIRPLQGLKGWSKALLTAELSEEEGRKALEWILSDAEFLESLNEALGAYLEKYRKPASSA